MRRFFQCEAVSLSTFRRPAGLTAQTALRLRLRTAGCRSSLRANMFTLMADVIRDSKSQGLDKLVLIILANHQNKVHDCCWPSLRTVAKEAGISQRRVRMAIANLIAIGEVRRLIGVEKWGTNRYFITLQPRQTMLEGEEQIAEEVGTIDRTPGTDCRLTSKQPAMEAAIEPDAFQMPRKSAKDWSDF